MPERRGFWLLAPDLAPGFRPPGSWPLAFDSPPLAFGSSAPDLATGFRLPRRVASGRAGLTR